MAHHVNIIAHHVNIIAHHVTRKTNAAMEIKIRKRQ